MISVITVGKKHEPWIQPGLERYETRLRRPYDVKWILLPHSSADGMRARQEESEGIFSRLTSSDFVVLLDEIGKNYSSPEISELLEQQFIHSRNVVIIIGGAYGVSEELQHRADKIWSLSKLVFPHQLVRLMLLEQLYRSQSIASGSGYHHA